MSCFWCGGESHTLCGECRRAVGTGMLITEVEESPETKKLSPTGRWCVLEGHAVNEFLLSIPGSDLQAEVRRRWGCAVPPSKFNKVMGTASRVQYSIPGVKGTG